GGRADRPDVHRRTGIGHQRNGHRRGAGREPGDGRHTLV
ncbi:MAG: hypothetical protein AVDCRST_MAG33-1829, partial [uncultured Thermomicrobiales bacterium]